MRRKLYCLFVALNLLASCSLWERTDPADEYDWTLDQNEIVVYDDLSVTLNVLGSNIPDVIKWCCEPEHFVRYIVSDGGRRCLVQRREDGECTLIARGSGVEHRVKVKVERYTRNGLHLRINGEDMFFPMIEPNYPRWSDVNRYFTVHLDRRDTIEIEVVEWLPKELERELLVTGVDIFSNVYCPDGPCFLYNYPGMEVYRQTSSGGVSFGKGEEKPFESVKGALLRSTVWLFDFSPWEITEGEHKWRDDYEVVPQFSIGLKGGYFGVDKWGDEICAEFQISFLLREDSPGGIVDFDPVYVL